MPDDPYRKPRLLTGDVVGLDDTGLFDRYASAVIDSQYHSTPELPVELWLARTQPIPAESCEPVRRGLLTYLRRPGGATHHPVRQYGEIVYCCRVLEPARSHEAAQRSIAWLGVDPLWLGDAVSAESWDLFMGVRRDLLLRALHDLDAPPSQQYLPLSRLLADARLGPGANDWHVYHTWL